ncbi:MAG: hypothetical protein ACTS3F_01310 [Phycisphaerales bacterium]
MLITLAGHYDDTAADLIRLCESLAPIGAEPSGRKWQVQAREARYLGPYAAAVLGALHLQGLEREQEPRIALPTEPPALDAFCAFSGMKHWFDDAPPPSRTHPQSETVPLLRFMEPGHQIPDDTIRLINRHTTASEDFEHQFATAIREVTQNVHDHAQSPVGGVMCCRYIKQTQSVRACVVDVGVGVHESLRRAGKAGTDEPETLRLVTRGGVSAKSRSNNMGIGLSLLWDIVEACRGQIVLISHRAVATHHNGQSAFRLLQHAFPGTVVGFSLPVHEIE